MPCKDLSSFERFKRRLGIWGKLVEPHQFFTGLITANRAVIQTLVATALPDSTRVTICDQSSSVRFTSIAVDLLRLQIKGKFLAIRCGGFRPGDIIVILGRQKRGAIGAYKATIGYHLGHKHSSHFVIF
jgi:hypothetical protein